MTASRTKILVVEDEPLLMMMAVGVIEDAGFEAIEASNADEAIALLESDPAIVILWTDIDMPGFMDGLKLAAAVPANGRPISYVLVAPPGLVRQQLGDAVEIRLAENAMVV